MVPGGVQWFERQIKEIRESKARELAVKEKELNGDNGMRGLSVNLALEAGV
jgi:hypothetical protein